MASGRLPTTIPGDRSSWGAFDMLDERSIAVQRQLAEQAAADPAATGVEKIVSDFWATGMDEAKINAQGIAPMKDRLAAIDALADRDTVAGYLRSSAAKGENVLFGFGFEADFKDSTMNMAYAIAGRPWPAGSRLLLRRGQEGQARRLPGARRQGARAVGHLRQRTRRPRRRP